MPGGLGGETAKVTPRLLTALLVDYGGASPQFASLTEQLLAARLADSGEPPETNLHLTMLGSTGEQPRYVFTGYESVQRIGVAPWKKRSYTVFPSNVSRGAQRTA